eukprot:TRINITY_DN92111_c0_g1_i1.p1 TRINITY_DN92111_c0_g1~~TRINITY_DN92111_c0_g1_i1.p1  ORF type:complete len:321 (-),score=57.09 TRINITY_DN92111_c0_g1_i1:14-976(-)
MKARRVVCPGCMLRWFISRLVVFASLAGVPLRGHEVSAAVEAELSQAEELAGATVVDGPVEADEAVEQVNEEQNARGASGLLHLQQQMPLRSLLRREEGSMQGDGSSEDGREARQSSTEGKPAAKRRHRRARKAPLTKLLQDPVIRKKLDRSRKVRLGKGRQQRQHAGEMEAPARLHNESQAIGLVAGHRAADSKDEAHQQTDLAATGKDSESAAAGSDRTSRCEWSEWSSWQSCSRSCGDGTQSRTREERTRPAQPLCPEPHLQHDVKVCMQMVCPETDFAVAGLADKSVTLNMAARTTAAAAAGSKWWPASVMQWFRK